MMAPWPLATITAHPCLTESCSAPTFSTDAGVAELADAQDLKSWVAKAACGFDSRPRHEIFGNSSDSGPRRTAARPQTSADADYSWRNWSRRDSRHECLQLLTRISARSLRT